MVNEGSLNRGRDRWGGTRWGRKVEGSGVGRRTRLPEAGDGVNSGEKMKDGGRK